MPREQPPRRLDAVDAAGQQQILDNDLRPPLVEPLEQLFAARRDAREPHVIERFEIDLQAARNNAMVVDDSNGDHHAALGRLAERYQSAASTTPIAIAMPK